MTFERPEKQHAYLQVYDETHIAIIKKTFRRLSCNIFVIRLVFMLTILLPQGMSTTSN